MADAATESDTRAAEHIIKEYGVAAPEQENTESYQPSGRDMSCPDQTRKPPRRPCMHVEKAPLFRHWIVLAWSRKGNEYAGGSKKRGFPWFWYGISDPLAGRRVDQTTSHGATNRVGGWGWHTWFDVSFGTPSGIRTRDLHLERVTSWSTRLWGLASQRCLLYHLTPFFGKSHTYICTTMFQKCC